MSGAHLHPEAAAALLAAAALYAAGARRVPRWPARRAAAFLGGVAVALAALATPRAEQLVAAHMVQHVGLTLVAAPLLVTGAPLSLALRATRGAAHRRLRALVRARAARVLVHPACAGGAFAATTLATHLTPLYDLAVRVPAVHAAEHVAYLATASLFWAPLLGANPLPQLRSWLGRTAYLLLAMPAMSAVAAVLSSAASPRYPAHAAAAARLGRDALADQRSAGLIMWAAGTAALVAAALGLGAEALLREERRRRTLEALERDLGRRRALR